MLRPRAVAFSPAAPSNGPRLPFALTGSGEVDDGSFSARGVFGVRSMIPLLPIVVITDVFKQGMVLQDKVPSFDVLLRTSIVSGTRFWASLATGAGIYHVAEAASRAVFPGPPIVESAHVAAGVQAAAVRGPAPPGPSRASRALGGAVAGLSAGAVAATLYRTANFYSSGPIQSALLLAAMGAVASQLVPTYEAAMAHRAATM
jgi:hypothetical protein